MPALLNVSQTKRLKALNGWLWRKKGIKLTPDGFCNGDAAAWGLSMLDKNYTVYAEITNFLAQDPTVADFEKLEENHFKYMSSIRGKDEISKQKIQEENPEIYHNHWLYLKIEDYISGILLPFDPASVIEDLSAHDYDRTLSIITGGYVDEGIKKDNKGELDIAPIAQVDWQDHNISKRKDLLIQSEYVFGFTLKKQELIKIIPEMIPQNKIVMIGAPWHTCACFFDGKKYHFFDPNSEVGAIECPDSVTLADAIQESLIGRLYPDEKANASYDNIPVQFFVLDYARNPKANYPTKATLIQELFERRGGINPETANLESAHFKYTALPTALNAGDSETAKILLSPPFSEFHSENTLSHAFPFASRTRDFFSLQKILEKGQAPIAYPAAINGDLSVLQYLLEEGAPWQGLLKGAAGFNRIRTFKYLFQKYPYSQKEIKEAFEFAAQKGNLEILEHMLNENLLAFNKPECIKHALFSALVSGESLPTIRLLLNQPESLDINPRLLFAISLNASEKSVAVFMLEIINLPQEELQNTLEIRSDEIISLIAELIAQNKEELLYQKIFPLPQNWPQIINSPLKNSIFTPLIHYVRAKDYKMVTFLLNNGASPNVKTNLDQDALLFALQARDIQMIEILLSANASVNTIFKDNTFFTFFSATGEQAILKLLLDLMQQHDMNGEFAKNLFKSSVKKNNIPLVKALIERGIPVDMNAMLRLAKDKRHPRMAILLEEAIKDKPKLTRYDTPITVGFKELKEAKQEIASSSHPLSENPIQRKKPIS